MDSMTPVNCYETPKSSDHFVFPPRSSLVSSIDRLIPNVPLNCRSRRSFTPYKGSLMIQTPDISPIELDLSKFQQEIIYLTPENKCKAPADGTTNTLEDLPSEDRIPLMPPPRGRPLRSASVQESARNPLLVRLWDENQVVTSSGISMDSQLESPQNKSNFLNEQINVFTTLAYIGLSKYMSNFQKEKIDFNMFLTLTNESLIAIGVTQDKDRQVILNFIKELSVSKNF